MSDAANGPCGNEECDKCNPLPRFKIVTERVQRLFYTREIKAKDEADALRIYNEGTEWPSSYDDHYGEIIERHDPVITVEPPREAEHIEMDCFHNLPRREEFVKTALDSMTSCYFCGDSGCSDMECPRCHPANP
jgi:hypothetical protein